MNDSFCFDDIQPGQRAELRRTRTPEDGQALATLAGALAATGEVGTPEQGLWPDALLAALLHTRFPGAGTVCESRQLVFHHPQRDAGETLTASLTVARKDIAAQRLWLDLQVCDPQGVAVCSGHAVVRAPRHGLGAPSLARGPEAASPLDAWIAQQAGGHPPVRCAVAHPCDASALRGAIDATQRGLIEPVLVAPLDKLRALAHELEISLDGLTLIDVPHSHAAAAQAAALAARGEVAMLMKGSLHTDELMAAVLAERALRTARRMSHVFHFHVPAYPKPLMVTDAAINIAPTLEVKADIARNVIELAHALGLDEPRLAILSAVETVTPTLASTLDAAALCKMADRGQISGARLDGPLAFDNAISAEAARVKGIVSPVAGQADILLVPDLVSGNMLAKQLEYLAGASGCGLVLGAQVPIALTSRADSVLARLASAALCGVMARAQGKA